MKKIEIEQELTNLFKSKNNNNKSKLKKGLFKILLKVHPDKCKNHLINSNELTKKNNKFIETLK